MNKIIAFLSAFCLYAGNSAAQSTPLLPGSEGALGACRADERKQTSELFGMKVAVVQTISPLKNDGCRAGWLQGFVKAFPAAVSRHTDRRRLPV